MDTAIYNFVKTEIEQLECFICQKKAKVDSRLKITTCGCLEFRLIVFQKQREIIDIIENKLIADDAEKIQKQLKKQWCK